MQNITNNNNLSQSTGKQHVSPQATKLSKERSANIFVEKKKDSCLYGINLLLIIYLSTDIYFFVKNQSRFIFTTKLVVNYKNGQPRQGNKA